MFHDASDTGSLIQTCQRVGPRYIRKTSSECSSTVPNFQNIEAKLDRCFNWKNLSLVRKRWFFLRL